MEQASTRHAHPTPWHPEIDDMIGPLKATIDFKVKGNAVKQEVEKNQELVRSALRAVASLSKLADTGKLLSVIFIVL